MAALRASLIAADSVLLTLAPSGDHLLAVISRMGLMDTANGKLRRFDTSTLLNRHLVDTAGAGALAAHSDANFGIKGDTSNFMILPPLLNPKFALTPRRWRSCAGPTAAVEKLQIQS